MEGQGKDGLECAECWQRVGNSENCRIRPEALLLQPLFPEEAHSQGMSGDIQGRQGTSGMRNTWMPRCPEKVKVSLPCLTLCDPMDYTVHGILQARILEWLAVPFCRDSLLFPCCRGSLEASFSPQTLPQGV